MSVRHLLSKAELTQALTDARTFEPRVLASVGSSGPQERTADIWYLRQASAISHAITSFEPLDPSWIERCEGWIRTANVDDTRSRARVVLAAIATVCCAGLYARCAGSQAQLEGLVRHSANRAEFLCRKASSTALQLIGETHPDWLCAIGNRWLDGSAALELAVLLDVTQNDKLVKHGRVRQWGFEVCEAAIDLIEQDEKRLGKAAFHALRQALGTTPSILTHAAPADGFAMLERWADRGRLTTAKVVAANLNKARIRREFEHEAAELAMRLEACAYDECREPEDHDDD